MFIFFTFLFSFLISLVFICNLSFTIRIYKLKFTYELFISNMYVNPVLQI